MKKVSILFMMSGFFAVFGLCAMDNPPAKINQKALMQLVNDAETEMAVELQEGEISKQTANKTEIIEKLCVVTGNQKAATRLHKKRLGVQKPRIQQGIKPKAQQKLDFTKSLCDDPSDVSCRSEAYF